MKVTIITATFNNAKTIMRAVASLTSQSYKNIEHIVIDNRSCDGTLELLKKFSHPIRIISETDKGLYHALNKGIDLAKGEIIAFLHADDLYYSSSVIESIVNTFENNPEIKGVYGNLIYFSQENFNKIIRIWRPGKLKYHKIYKGWMLPHPTLFLRKDIYLKFGKFDTNFKISADYDFILRIIINKVNLLYLQNNVYKMSTGGISNKNLKHITLKSYEDFLILKKNKVGSLFTLIAKNIFKLNQFIKRDRE